MRGGVGGVRDEVANIGTDDEGTNLSEWESHFVMLHLRQQEMGKRRDKDR